MVWFILFKEIPCRQGPNRIMDNLGRAGWNLIVNKVSGGKSTDEELLATVEAELQTDTPGKQRAMNHALCEIGIRYSQFTRYLFYILKVYGDVPSAI